MISTFRSRTEGSKLEIKLRAYFTSPRAEKAMHAAMDLLTVWYFDALGRADEKPLNDTPDLNTVR